jgi:quercetin dioxygenase-like cupin family protein
MQILRFDSQAGNVVSAFSSKGATVVHALPAGTACSVVAIHLQPGGVLGAHPAAQQQLFLVVAGGGRFRGAERIWHDASPGRAAFWSKGEVHETRAGPEGLTAIVLEGEGLGEAIVLPPWKD